MRDLLILSFSDISKDARVLRQLDAFSSDFNVSTCGYGPPPRGSVNHFEIPREAVAWRYPRLDLILHLYRRAYWRNRAVQSAEELLHGQRFDVVLANDFNTLPLAVSLRPRFGVHADIHEHFGEGRGRTARHRLFVTPFERWVLKKYLPQCASVTTVASGIGKDYESRYGISMGVVRNTSHYHDLPAKPVQGPISLVHSGGCQRGRRPMDMVDAVIASSNDVTLDLYLIPNEPDLLAELKDRAASTNRIRVHDPVPQEDLVAVLNQYDVGLSFIAPTTFSYLWALPNKFFDYVQARLGIIVGPSPEMAPIVAENHLGAVTKDFSVRALTDTIDKLTPKQVEQWKQASNAFAQEVSSATEIKGWVEPVNAMLTVGAER